jgi:hypothetical protein
MWCMRGWRGRGISTQCSPEARPFGRRKPNCWLACFRPHPPSRGFKLFFAKLKSPNFLAEAWAFQFGGAGGFEPCPGSLATAGAFFQIALRCYMPCHVPCSVPPPPCCLRCLLLVKIVGAKRCALGTTSRRGGAGGRQIAQGGRSLQSLEPPATRTASPTNTRTRVLESFFRPRKDVSGASTRN